jgi:triacylglycerol lipase
MINLKYPLILVHGAGFRDKTVGIKYWGRVPRYLFNEGLAFYFGGTDAWGNIESNGELLKETVLFVLENTEAEKVNILAHSRGGLEARYAISALGMENNVASLTTISTPHSGAKVMNIVLKFPQRLYRVVSVIVNIISALMGDNNPDFFRSSRQLSESWCSEYNRVHPNKEGIYYQSYASVFRFFFGNLMFLFTWILVRIFDGPNDGLCPVESAKWGDFRGTVTGRFLGMSHSGILDFYRSPFRGVCVVPPVSGPALPPEQQKPMKVPEFYVSIIRELSEKGF